MATDIYVALSGHVALERRLATVAQNVANLGTAGFRAEEIHFEAILSAVEGESTAFAWEGESYISRRPGGLVPTGNPLDVAIDGRAWFGIATPDGEVAYTRDGRFRMTEAGDLVTATGHPVLDPGGGPIALDPAAGTPAIGRDGTIVQRGERQGVIGLFLLPETADLERFGDSAVVSDAQAAPADDRVANSVRQGFVEKANVDPVMELTRLIMIQRQFESIASALDARDRNLRGAIRELGPSG